MLAMNELPFVDGRTDGRTDERIDYSRVDWICGDVVVSMNEGRKLSIHHHQKGWDDIRREGGWMRFVTPCEVRFD